MKIIGETNEGFIATVSYKEIDSILAIGDSRKGKVKESIKVGSDLSFTLALQNLNLIKDIQLTESYSVLSKLKDAMVSLDTVISNVEGLKTPLYEVKELIKTGQA